jgi:predicted secreted hydrolase
MQRVLVVLMLALVACAPTSVRQLDSFVERKPDPKLDQGAHNAPVEWWYVNGHLETPSGPKGFAAAIFQVLIPPNLTVNGVSAANLIPGPLYFGHYSTVDKTTGRFQYAELSTLPTATPDIKAHSASASKQQTDVRLGDWRMVRDANDVFNMNFKLSDGTDNLQIRLEPTRPLVVHGPGWSGSRETGRMYYYSATRLRVTGTMNDQPVSGIAWFDHQWGGGFGLDASGVDGGDGSASLNPRWDWFSLQLEDGRDIMVYRVKNARGGIADEYVSVNTPDGRVTSSRNFSLRPLSTHKASSGAEYPVLWVLRLESGERFEIVTLANNQEVRSEATAGFSYYEGAVRVSGPSSGVGYMELTGYGPMRNLLNPFGQR